MIVNGQAQQHIAIADRAVQYGDGCFTTIAFKNGCLEFLDAHIQRLKLACDRLYIQFNEWAELETCLIESLKNVDDCVVKIIISRGQGGRGYSPEGAHSTSYILTHHAYPSHYNQWQKDGIKLTHSSIQLARQPLLAGIKHLNRLEQVLVKQALATTAYDDAVVCDTEQNIVETSVGNLFWYQSNTWYTPDLSYAGVEGVMRNQVVAILNENNINQQQIVSVFDVLEDAEEVFVCNSLMGIVPVTCVYNPNTNQTINYKCQQTKQLQSMLQNLTTKEVTKL